MSIRVRSFLAMMAIICVISVVAAKIWSHVAQARLLEMTERNLLAVGEAASALIGNDIEHIKIASLAVVHNIIASGNSGLPAELDHQLEIFKEFSALEIIGKEDSSSDAGDEYIKRALDGKTVIITSRRDEQQGSTILRVYTPMREGVLRATVNCARLSNLLSRCGIRNTGYVFVDDGNGTIIAGSRPGASETAHGAVYDHAAAEIMRTAPQEKRVVRFFSDGKEHFGSYLPIDDVMGNWSIGVVAPLQKNGQAHPIWGTFAALAFCSLGGMVVVYSSKKISKPFVMINGKSGHGETSEAKTPEANDRWDFLSNMSAEMQMPVNAIIRLSETSLDSGRIQKEDYEILEKIYHSGVILSDFVSDITEIAKTEFANFYLKADEYDTAGLINDAISLNIMRIEDKPVKFGFHIDESFPAKLWGDELKVKYTFNNILSNAFKYTHKGFIDWRLYCEKDERDGMAVWIVSEVRDTGVGISGEDVRRIMSRPANGAGQGLAIARRFAEMMRGDITAESERGIGSVFTARIRQVLTDDKTIGAETVRELQSFHYVDARRRNSSKFVRESIPYASVLVVDDDESVLESARAFLKPYGMRVDCVDSGQAAIELIMEEDVKYNAIFLDHMMPVMDGIETIRLLRRIGTEYANNIPIIGLSSNKAMAREEMFLKKGFQAFLAKPVDVMRLNNIINRWIRDDGRNK